MSLAEGLSLVGAFLSAAGVAITLWGTRTTRNIAHRLGLPRPEPITGTVEVLQQSDTMEAYGWTTPPVGIPLEGVSSEGVGTFTPPEPQIMKSIEELRRLLRTHQHSGYQRTLERLEGRVDQLRTDVQATFDGLASDSDKADRLNAIGLVLAFGGLLLQGLAIFA